MSGSHIMSTSVDRARARPAHQPPVRNSLYVATMLVPLVGTLALAAGKVALQSSPHLMQVIGLGMLAPPARAQSPVVGGLPANPVAPAPPVSATNPLLLPSTAGGANNPPFVPSTAGSAVSVLLNQASFWHDQGEPEKARQSLDRVLAIAPDNADALVLMALVESERGEQQQAEAALARLRRVAPDDPRINATAQALRVGALPAETLAHARQLARDGHTSEAIQAYEQILHGGKVPAPIAVEYYLLLAGTETGWEAARDGLAQTVRDNPLNLRAQLAYAELLTYREGASREEGIGRLALLARTPAVAEQARDAWRQSLLWLPDGTDRVDLLQAYLREHPDDAEISAKVNSPTRVRQQAYDAITARRLEEAANLFTKALSASPDDIYSLSGLALVRFRQGRLDEAAELYSKELALNPSDAAATGMLGIVRMRQRNVAEAKALLTHAIELDPDQRGAWLGALNALNNGRTWNNGGKWAAGPTVNPARAMIARGNLDAAERELRHQIARGGNIFWSRMMLADVLVRQGRLGEAETTYRAALASSPGNAAAALGLASLLGREGHHQEAADLLAHVQQTGTNSRLVAQVRAQILREQAEGITDSASQEALYREAVEADPGNPWLRLDLARTLVKLGRQHDAQVLMAQAVAGRASVDALKAGIIFANDTNDTEAASSLIARLPPAAMTADLRTTQRNVAVQREIAAAMLLPRDAARERLLAIAAVPGADPYGVRGGGAARALLRLGDKAAARDAIVAAEAAARPLTNSARLTYAGVLAGAGYTEDSSALVAQIGDDAELTREQREGATKLRAGLAVRTSDTLNQQGRQADAYDELAPSLAQTPQDPGLNMALARLYQGARQPREALAINEALVRRDPANMAARRAAVDAALQVRDLARASALAQEGLTLAPNDPQAWITASDVDRARGHVGQALHELQRARELRLQQLGTSQRDVETPAPPRVQGSATEPVEAPVQVAGTLLQQPESLASPVTDYPPRPFAVVALVDDSGAGAVPQSPEPAILTTPLAQPATAQPLLPPAGDDTGLMPPPAQPATAQLAPAGGNTAPFGQTPNPFRSNSSVGYGMDSGTGAPSDTVTAEIDRSIAALRAQVAPTMQVGFDFRDRSGDEGLGKLDEYVLPLEATFSPAGVGRLTLLATPTLLQAGSLGKGTYGQIQFGTGALGLSYNPSANFTSYVGASPGFQQANGVGLDLAYQLNNLKADIGATPIGFRENTVIGGVEWAPQITDRLRLRLTAGRRAVDDSLLSYAGTKDSRTGQDWGGVTRNGGRAAVEFSAGKADFYAGAGVNALVGRHVKNNTDVEAGAGTSFAAWRDADEKMEIRTGLDLVFLDYSKNLDYFTYGQGGYFSPQRFFAALVPLTFKQTVNDDLSYEVGGAVGVQTFHDDSSLLYPNDPSLEAALEASTVPGVPSYYGGQNETGIAGYVHAAIDYRVTPSLHLGARISYAHAGNYDETNASVFARYVFNGAD
jgi:tetratricopeptide (TPR) repeat protein